MCIRDSGCHGMVLLMDDSKVGDIAGITAMGAEGTQFIGMAPFVEREHFIQNLGDGTFFHSGQLAIQASVAAGMNTTYKLLYNGTVAMTGGQDAVGGEARQLGAGAGAAGRAVVGPAGAEHEVLRVGVGAGRGAENLDVIDLAAVRTRDPFAFERLPDVPGEVGERVET